METMHEEKETTLQEKFKYLPSEIAFQILPFLHIKALMRFKSVSTCWSSYICHPDFKKEHWPCGSILLNITSDDSSCSMKGLFYASMHVGGNSEQIQDLKTETFVHRISLPYLGYENITPVVNGLACLYTVHRASLINISTLEIMELPSSTLYLEASRILYALGFDPIDNVYKLLKVSVINTSNYHKVEYQLAYEILTLDTSSKSTWKWRKIVVSGYWSSFFSVQDQSYFVNGIIFWRFCDQRKREVIAFDVHQEKFTTIERPQMLLSIRRFGQFEGRLAVCYTHIQDTSSSHSWVLDLYVLEDHQESLWTKNTINLPAEIDKYFHEATPIGNFPSGELLFSCFESQKLDNSFFIYDPIKRKFTKLMIELPRSLAVARRREEYPAHMSCIFERITSLDNLVGFRNK